LHIPLALGPIDFRHAKGIHLQDQRRLACPLPRDGRQVSRKLADFNDQYRTKCSVRLLADEVLDLLEQGLQVNGPMTLQQYAETAYFPNIKTKKSPSTVKGYVNLYSAQIQSRIGGFRLSTCTTADIQRLLELGRRTSTRWRKSRRLQTRWTAWKVRGRGRRVDGSFARRTSRLEVARHRTGQRTSERESDAVASEDYRNEDFAQSGSRASAAERNRRIEKATESESGHVLGLRRSTSVPARFGYARVQAHQDCAQRCGC
jgi:hypothetical protein